MIIKSLKLKNYKCFENKEVNFDSLNFIVGHNGAGKSTLIEAVIFALYGYTAQAVLADIPTRNRAKSCSSELVIEKNNVLYRIIRHFPLKLQLYKNNQLLNLSTAEANQAIVDTFGTRENFFRFRLIDTSQKETNFLEEGQVTLKKIIFGGTDDYFNRIRIRLTEIKAERERLNKDTCVVYTHYPSETRLNTLITNLGDISNSLVIASQDLANDENDVKNNKIKIATIQNKIEYLTKQISNVDTIKSSYDNQLIQIEARHAEIQRTVGELNKQIDKLQAEHYVIINKNICYVCQRPLEEKSSSEIKQEQEKQMTILTQKLATLRNEDIEICNTIPILKESIIKERQQKVEDFKKEIAILNIEIASLNDYNKFEEEILVQTKQHIETIRFKKERLQELKLKLEVRLKQKAFIYTTNDVLIVKKAIEELDKMSSYYLVSTVQTLEPIINSILTKINFAVKFDVDTKGKFNIILTKDEIQYKYKDLSCGERLLLQIAFKIALLLHKNEIGILIADEGMSSLDSDNLQHILIMLEDLPFQMITVIHHFNEFPQNANVITLGG